MPASTKFHWKVFVSFYVVFSFLALAVSGIVLYVAPPGRVANWSVWQLLLLSKAQWQAVHTIVALAFLVAAGFHIYFNWKVLVAYVKSKLQAGIRMKRISSNWIPRRPAGSSAGRPAGMWARL